MAASYGFLSTHPPTQCGLATFNSSLADHLTAGGAPSGVVRVTAANDDQRAGPGVVHTWWAGTVDGWQKAAAALNAYDLAVVQHEYGIYPGKDGADVLPLLRRLTVPSIVVLHTVLSQPTAGQKTVLEQVVAAAGAVVTMTDTARDRLVDGYRVDPAKAWVIPHGAADHAATNHAATNRAVTSHAAVPGSQPRPHLLTWGLLGPGKGIEWVLHALTHLRDLDPAPIYTVAGRTHPKVLQHHGEAYRASLHVLGDLLGVSGAVTYQPTYRDQAALGSLIRSADVVVLPYDSREQVTSGVLIEAVAAGVPVIATPFPHAVELLSAGTGLLVPHQDPAALAAAIRRILTEPGLAAHLASRARPLRPALRWPAVAARYDELAQRLLTTGASAVAVAPA